MPTDPTVQNKRRENNRAKRAAEQGLVRAQATEWVPEKMKPAVQTEMHRAAKAMVRKLERSARRGAALPDR